MFEIKPVEVDIPTMLSPTEELTSIIDNYSLGTAVTEVALYRVFRLWKTDSYEEVYDDGRTDPLFSSAADFVKFITKRMNISRSKVYTRLRTYSIMEFLDYGDVDIVLRMARKPSLYEKALDLIYSWDEKLREVLDFKTDKFGDNPFDGVTKARVRYFLEELENADSVSDALKILEEESESHYVKFTYFPNENNFVLTYKDDDIDANNGMSILGDTIRVTYQAFEGVPDWVSDELARKFGEKL